MGHTATPSPTPLGSCPFLPRLFIFRLRSEVNPNFIPCACKVFHDNTHQKQWRRPVLVTAAQLLLQTTTTLALNGVGEVFKSLHGAFNDYLKIKCFGKPTTLLIADPGKLQPFNYQGTQAPCSPLKKTLARQTSTSLERSVEHRLCTCTLAGIPTVTLGTSLKTEQISPEQQFYLPPPHWLCHDSTFTFFSLNKAHAGITE